MTLGDSKLGESKLGVPITPDTLPEPEETPRERATEYVKSPFKTGEDTRWDDFLNLVTAEFEHEYATLRDIERHRHVDTASGAPLDKIGAFVHLDRNAGETDPHFRRRIKLQLPKHTTSATLNELIEDSTLLLDCDPEQLEIRETWDVEPARFDVFVREQVLSDADVSVSEYVDLLREVKAAGVRAVATVGKQFTHRSQYEFDNGINDAERSYANEDGSIEGGPYADIITARHRTASDFDEEPAPRKPEYDGFGDGRFGESIYGV